MYAIRSYYVTDYADVFRLVRDFVDELDRAAR